MLTHIQIRDFAIIETLSLDLSAGMSALTGETGAGKSILLDAIGLVLGDKADTQTVRHGAEKADITLTIETQRTPHVQTWLQTQELATEDNDCILRRVVNAQGKSRAWINGSPATLTQLRELGEQLVDIHGQHEHQSLMKKDAQRALLDGFAHNDELLHATRQAWQHWKSISDRITQLTQQSQSHQERLDLLKFQQHELDALALQPNELHTLDEELTRLGHADELRTHTAHAYDTLYDADNSLYAAIGRVLQQLIHQAALDTQLNAPIELLTSAHIQLQEAATQLRDYAENLEIDPQRLQWVEQRVADIRHLARKYRLEPQQLPTKLAAIEAELAQLNTDDYDIDALQQQRSHALTHYKKHAQKLTERRQHAALTLSDGVSTAMQQLGMQGGRFVIALNTDPELLHAQGNDNIEFLVSANPGQPLKPLLKVASGGELSRISLAIQMMAAQTLTLPTLIFDEVDTGIGGGIAEIIGKQLRNLGEARQVLCVTHLPQVASQAHNHYKVTKIKQHDTTSTGIEQLDKTERVEEIARMIGGVEITSATRTLANEMLGNR